MDIQRPAHARNATPPQNFLPVLHKLKAAYLDWFASYSTLAKIHRFTIGRRIDDLLIECVELVSAAGFAKNLEKIPDIRLAIRKLDTTKLLLLILWETKSLDDRKYTALSVRLEEIGQNLGGWIGGILKKNEPPKQNSPEPVAGEK